MSQYQFFTDGVNRRFNIPFSSALITSVEGMNIPYTPAPYGIWFDTLPEAGILVGVNFELPTFNQDGPAVADGGSRTYVINQDTVPGSTAMWKPFLPFGMEEPTAVFLLSEVTTGDRVTILIDSLPPGFSYFHVVLPIECRRATVEVRNNANNSAFLFTGDAVGEYYVGEGFAYNPGIEQLSPGFTQMAVLDDPEGESTDRILRVTNVQTTIQTSQVFNGSVVNPVNGTRLLTAYVPDLVQGSPFGMPLIPPQAITAYANGPISLRLRLSVKGWDGNYETLGECTWKTSDSGAFAGYLSYVDDGNGGYMESWVDYTVVTPFPSGPMGGATVTPITAHARLEVFLENSPVTQTEVAVALGMFQAAVI